MGGQVGVDDWRGLMLFPGHEDKTYTGEWIEDDGVSVQPEYAWSRVVLRYSRFGRGQRGARKKVDSSRSGGQVAHSAAVGDIEESKAKQTTWKDRTAWVLEL